MTCATTVYNSPSLNQATAQLLRSVDSLLMKTQFHRGIISCTALVRQQMSEQMKVARLMAIESITKLLSLKCARCGTAGVPLRVESQINTTVVLAFHCHACAIEWTAEAVLPVFLAWVKPDRRRRMRFSGSADIQPPSCVRH